MPHPALRLAPAALLLATLLASTPQASDAPALSASMADFVAGLDADQRDTALYAFDDDERFDLRLAPLGLEGLRLDEMTDAQWRTLRGLLEHVLSTEGLEKLDTIRSLEREVAEVEGGLFGFLMDRIRDPKRYFLALFGEPANDRPWGFRFDGHHLSINATSIPEAPLSATPFFLGAQPRVVPDGLERAGLRALPEEEERAVAFLNGLTTEERTRAHIRWKEGSGIRRPMSISGDVDLVLPAASGLRRTSLGAEDRARLDRVIEVHLGNFAPPVAARLRRTILEGDGPVTIEYASFADDPGVPVASGRALYYRIQGGGGSIEFDDTASAADHIHVVVRHPESDFGRDLLAEHLADSHGD